MFIQMSIKYLLAAITIFVLSIAGYGFYLWYTYIDNTVTSGEAYGFVIGENKAQSYKRAPGALSKYGNNCPVYIEIAVDSGSAGLLATDPGYTVLVQSFLHDIGYADFRSKDRWDFYFGGSYFDVLTLKFCEEKLCEIYRHRKKFELP